MGAIRCITTTQCTRVKMGMKNEQREKIIIRKQSGK